MSANESPLPKSSSVKQSHSTLMNLNNWRERLNYLALKDPLRSFQNAQEFVFIWDGENYLIKMINDTLFLKESVLAKYFSFSSKSDPFLLTPSQYQNSVPAKKKTAKSKK